MLGARFYRLPPKAMLRSLPPSVLTESFAGADGSPHLLAVGPLAQLEALLPSVADPVPAADDALTQHVDVKVGDTIDDRYSILEVLSEGVNSTTYVANGSPFLIDRPDGC